jgi:hypothetical protein
MKVSLFPTGEIDVPAPEVYWMERFSEWTTLRFQMLLIETANRRVLLNTGFPEAIAPLAEAWKDVLGERAILKRPKKWKTRAHLESVGLTPDDITDIIISPIQLYATGNLALFRKAVFHISRKGWIEDIIAPTYPHHVPRQGCISDQDLLWLMGENNEKLHLLEDVAEVAPGITTRWIGVHHRSSIAVEIATASGRVIASDCAFHYENVEKGIPLGIAESIIEAHAAYEYIRNSADIFIPIYDPEVQNRFPGGVIE